MPGLRGLVALLVAGTGLWGDFAHAEGAVPEPGAQAAVEPAPPDAPAAASHPGQNGEAQEAWWAHARDVLFRDLELSPEQARGVDEILEGQRKARARARELQAELVTARRERNRERGTALREELRAIRTSLKNPHATLEEMRALLADAQHPTFDMNRAHLVAENQQSRKAEPARGARQPARRSPADAGPDTE